MEQYIKKSALVEEIERIKKSIGSDRFLSEFEKGCNQGKEEVCDDLRNFLDTIEVKEIELGKEIAEVQHNYMVDNNRHTSICSADIEWLAVHFFELGVKTQKGE